MVAKALHHKLADTLAVVEENTLGDTLVCVKPEAYVRRLADKLAETKTGTLLSH